MNDVITLKIPAKLVFVEIAAVFLQEIMNEAPYDCSNSSVSVAIKDLLSRIILSEKNSSHIENSDHIEINYFFSGSKLEIEILDSRKSLQSNSANVLNEKNIYGNVFDSFSYYAQHKGSKNLHKLTLSITKDQ